MMQPISPRVARSLSSRSSASSITDSVTSIMSRAGGMPARASACATSGARQPACRCRTDTLDTQLEVPALPQEALEVRRGLLQHPLLQWHDQPVVLREGDELVRGYGTEHR